jgi:hypothetical protein
MILTALLIGAAVAIAVTLLASIFLPVKLALDTLISETKEALKKHLGDVREGFLRKIGLRKSRFGQKIKEIRDNGSVLVGVYDRDTKKEYEIEFKGTSIDSNLKEEMTW